MGHVSSQCWHKNNKQVRNVEEEDQSQIPVSPNSTGKPSSTTTTTKNVQRVTLDDGSDLVIYDISEGAASSGHVRAVSVCMIADAPSSLVILDSGADITVILGRLAKKRFRRADPQFLLRDADGNYMENYGRCMVDFIVEGFAQDGTKRRMKIRDRGVLSDVKSPLLALGRLFQNGWEVRGYNGGVALFNEERYVPVVYKGNSLALEAVLEDEPKIEIEENMECYYIYHLEISLMDGNPFQRLREGWQLMSEEIVAWRGRSSTYVNLRDYLQNSKWAYRTTLFRKIGESQWYLNEYCESHEFLTKVDDELADVGGIEIEVIILVTQDFMVPEQLGFECENELTLEPEQAESQREQLEIVIAPDTSEFIYEPESPVASEDVDIEIMEDPEGGLQAEDVAQDEEIQGAKLPLRHAEGAGGADEMETPSGLIIKVDDVVLSKSSTLKVIRAACTKYKLSIGGSKETCLIRFRNHLRAQELALAADIQGDLEEAGQRQPKAPRLPKQPDKETRHLHELTHLPYMPWCEHCVAMRAMPNRHLRDKHKRDVSCLSYDFGYTSLGNEGMNKDEKKTKKKLTTRCLRMIATQVVSLRCQFLGRASPIWGLQHRSCRSSCSSLGAMRFVWGVIENLHFWSFRRCSRRWGIEWIWKYVKETLWLVTINQMVPSRRRLTLWGNFLEVCSSNWGAKPRWRSRWTILCLVGVKFTLPGSTTVLEPATNRHRMRRQQSASIMEAWWLLESQLWRGTNQCRKAVLIGQKWFSWPRWIRMMPTWFVEPTESFWQDRWENWEKSGRLRRSCTAAWEQCRGIFNLEELERDLDQRHFESHCLRLEESQSWSHCRCLCQCRCWQTRKSVRRRRPPDQAASDPTSWEESNDEPEGGQQSILDQS